MRNNSNVTVVTSRKHSENNLLRLLHLASYGIQCGNDTVSCCNGILSAPWGISTRLLTACTLFCTKTYFIFLAHRFSLFLVVSYFNIPCFYTNKLCIYVFTSFLSKIFEVLDHLHIFHKTGMHEYLRDGLIFLKCATRDWLSHAHPRSALEPIAGYHSAIDRPAPPLGSHSVTMTHFNDGSPTVTQSSKYCFLAARLRTLHLVSAGCRTGNAVHNQRLIF